MATNKVHIEPVDLKPGDIFMVKSDKKLTMKDLEEIQKQIMVSLGSKKKPKTLVCEKGFEINKLSEKFMNQLGWYRKKGVKKNG